MSKHAPGAYQYEATEDGRIWSISSNWRGYGPRELSMQINKDGYFCVRIMDNGRRRRVPVHRLVAAKFLPPRPTANHEIRHLNGDKTDNTPANLCWGTRAENAADRERHGRTSRGIKHSNAIIAGLAAKRVSP